MRDSVRGTLGMSVKGNSIESNESNFLQGSLEFLMLSAGQIRS
jgi:hypothetical protein